MRCLPLAVGCLSLLSVSACSSGEGEGNTVLSGSSTFTTGDAGTLTQGESEAGSADTQAEGEAEAATGDGDGDATTTTTGDGDGDTTTTTAGDGDGDTTTAGDGDGDATTATTNPTTSGDGDGDMGCEGVDFLFVIDNSGSMGDEQTALIASFDGFIDAIETRLQMIGADSFHIMVTDTDAASFEPDPGCLISCAALPGGNCLGTGISCDLYTPQCLISCQIAPNGVCNGQNCSDLAGCSGADACSCEIGAGVVSTPDGSSCGVTGGNLYMTEAQADPKTAFSCMANVGTDGSGSERQMDALTTALSGPLNGTGGCNQAFVRQNSILVVTVITDEEDTNSVGDPASWKTAVLDAKLGDEAGVVVLGLVGDTNTPNAVCGSMSGNSGADESPRLRQFVSSFQNNVLGSVCSPDYTSVFTDAVNLIEDTCNNFPIPQ